MTSLKTPARGVEALSEYTKMKKAQQDDLKDVAALWLALSPEDGAKRTP